MRLSDKLKLNSRLYFYRGIYYNSVKMADTPKRAIYGLDSSKYPARMGKGWDQEEIVKLLDSIRNKKSIEEIATEHERTVGGINSRRRGIATDYYFNNNLSIDKIQKFTGLTGEEIE